MGTVEAYLIKRRKTKRNKEKLAKIKRNTENKRPEKVE